jgi:hypothetical protein
MGRLSLLAALVLSIVSAQPAWEPPKWFSDRASFCSELARRTNNGDGAHLRRIASMNLDQYKVRPVAKPRHEQATIDQHLEGPSFDQAVKIAAAKGTDFAGRFAIVTWTCGIWCENAVIADVKTGTWHETPFVGAVGCNGVTGEHGPIETQANSRLLIVRGKLEIAYGNYFADGLCGTFAYLWQRNHLELIGCELSNK